MCEQYDNFHYNYFQFCDLFLPPYLCYRCGCRWLASRDRHIFEVNRPRRWRSWCDCLITILDLLLLLLTLLYLLTRTWIHFCFRFRLFLSVHRSWVCLGCLCLFSTIFGWLTTTIVSAIAITIAITLCVQHSPCEPASLRFGLRRSFRGFKHDVPCLCCLC